MSSHSRPHAGQHWRVPELPFATFCDLNHIYFIGNNTVIWFTIPKVQRSTVKSPLSAAPPLLGCTEDSPT